MNFGCTPLGGTMSKRESQIILKTASEAFISSHARPKVLPANQVIDTKDGVSLEDVKLGFLVRAGVGW
jgi:hypothetical protein